MNVLDLTKQLPDKDMQMGKSGYLGGIGFSRRRSTRYPNYFPKMEQSANHGWLSETSTGYVTTRDGNKTPITSTTYKPKATIHMTRRNRFLPERRTFLERPPETSRVGLTDLETEKAQRLAQFTQFANVMNKQLAVRVFGKITLNNIARNIGNIHDVEMDGVDDEEKHDTIIDSLSDAISREVKMDDPVSIGYAKKVIEHVEDVFGSPVVPKISDPVSKKFNLLAWIKHGGSNISGLIKKNMLNPLSDLLIKAKGYFKVEDGHVIIPGGMKISLSTISRMGLKELKRIVNGDVENIGAEVYQFFSGLLNEIEPSELDDQKEELEFKSEDDVPMGIPLLPYDDDEEKRYGLPRDVGLPGDPGLGIFKPGEKRKVEKGLENDLKKTKEDSGYSTFTDEAELETLRANLAKHLKDVAETAGKHLKPSEAEIKEEEPSNKPQELMLELRKTRSGVKKQIDNIMKLFSDLSRAKTSFTNEGDKEYLMDIVSTRPRFPSGRKGLEQMKSYLAKLEQDKKAIGLAMERQLQKQKR